ncbi:Inositol-pentakisphosphate 2-kinase [Actinomortierella wolfii]|nr:Inositol-pentakisphosphate 2-kinase [Actinomortierella wolfii]
MATIPELHVVAHWRYKAEGNANLVVQYIGPDPRFFATVMRLRKSDRILQPNLAREDIRLHAQAESAVKDLSKEITFQSKVMGMLLGDEFIEHPILVSVPRWFLEGLATAIEPARPHHRLQKGIDLTRETGFLSLDHTRFIQSVPSNPTVAVELKPKWGYMPSPHFIPDSAVIKRKKCRFCMYQYLKAVEAKEQELSSYCPIDLFSAQEGLVQYALDALVKTPQSNLRLFVDGEQKPVTVESMDRAFSAPLNDSLEPTSRGEETLEAAGVSLNALLTEILIRSPFLTRLRRLQQGLDFLDVEVIHRFYDSLLAKQKQLLLDDADQCVKDASADGTAASTKKNKKNGELLGLAEPTVDEYLTAAEAFLERSGLDALSEQQQQDSEITKEEFEERLRASIGFGPEDNLDEVPDAIKEHYIREFLLATTLKDCSLIITLERIVQQQQDSQHDEADDTNGDHHTPEQQAGGEHGFKERVHTLKMGGHEYRYKMVCIDLDPKKINAIPRYLDRDRLIVSHYLRVVGDREEPCGSH